MSIQVVLIIFFTPLSYLWSFCSKKRIKLIDCCGVEANTSATSQNCTFFSNFGLYVVEYDGMQSAFWLNTKYFLKRKKKKKKCNWASQFDLFYAWMDFTKSCIRLMLFEGLSSFFGLNCIIELMNIEKEKKVKIVFCSNRLKIEIILPFPKKTQLHFRCSWFKKID